MEIVLKDDELFDYTNNHIFGTIYLTVQGFAFPCDGWTDFIEEILTMWANELLSHNSKHYSHFHLSFMDGPYWLDVYKDNRMQLEIKCMDSDMPAYEFKCSYYDFLSAILGGMTSFADILHQKQRNAKACNFSGTLTCIKNFLNRIGKVMRDRGQEDGGTVSVNPKEDKGGSSV